MVTLSLVLLIAACVIFVLAACNVALGKLNLIALGLAAWTLSLFVQQIHF